MTDIISKIITNILTALYQPFVSAVLLTVLVMFFYLYAKEYGLKKSIKNWIAEFRESQFFRRLLLLAFYTSMILFRTLLDRKLWVNPLSGVMDGWTLTNANGELTTEPIENLILFIPFTVLLLWAISSREELSKRVLEYFSFGMVLWQSLKIVFIFSLTIEFLQLFLRLGSFQLSDLFYNTLGGGIGGIIYWIGYKVKHSKDGKNSKNSKDGIDN